MSLRFCYPILIAWFSFNVGSAQDNDVLSSGQVLFSKGVPEDVACYRIPALVTASNGDLLAVVDERVTSCADLRDNRDINLVLRRSIDGGRSWSLPVRLVNPDNHFSVSDPSWIQDDEINRLWLFYNGMDHNGVDPGYRIITQYSDDFGYTWSEPMDLTDMLIPEAWRTDFLFVTSGRGSLDRDGSLIHAMANLQHGVHVIRGINHGEQWVLEPEALPSVDESQTLGLPDGSWMVNSRVSGLGSRRVHRSSDQGRTWVSVTDSSLTDPACNAALLLTPDHAPGGASLLFCNVSDSHQRKNLTIRRSFDGGHSWPVAKEVWPGSAAYSSITLIGDSLVGILYERNDYSEIVFSVVSLEELILQDSFPEPVQ